MGRSLRLILLCMSFLLFTEGCGGTGVWYPELNRCGVAPTSDLSICDDGNRINGDGCDENCIRERLAVQTWYETPDCTGKTLKTVIRNIREYLVPEVCHFFAVCEWRLHSTNLFRASPPGFLFVQRRKLAWEAGVE
jgi:cysteine-rich repeat protein